MYWSRQLEQQNYNQQVVCELTKNTTHRNGLSSAKARTIKPSQCPTKKSLSSTGDTVFIGSTCKRRHTIRQNGPTTPQATVREYVVECL